MLIIMISHNLRQFMETGLGPVIHQISTCLISTLIHKQEGNSQQRNNNGNGSVTDCYNIANERHKHDQCYQFKCYCEHIWCNLLSRVSWIHIHEIDKEGTS